MIILLFNVDSSKTQKPGTIVSLDLADPQQSMLPVRTRGHAAKRDTNGKFVYICA